MWASLEFRHSFSRNVPKKKIMIRKVNFNIYLENQKVPLEFVYLRRDQKFTEHALPVCVDIIHPVYQAAEPGT